MSHSNEPLNQYHDVPVEPLNQPLPDYRFNLNNDVLVGQIVAGQILDIPPATLQKWRSTNEVDLPYIKIGRSIKYRTTDLKLWLDANTRNKMGVKA